MGWHIGRTEALSDPLAARRKAMAKLRLLAELDDPESVVVPILIDAIIMAESYRGARHEITFLPELTRSIDVLIRELNAVEKAKEWAERWPSNPRPPAPLGKSAGNRDCSARGELISIKFAASGTGCGGWTPQRTGVENEAGRQARGARMVAPGRAHRCRLGRLDRGPGGPRARSKRDGRCRCASRRTLRSRE